MVKRIFSLCTAGNGPKRIATILTKEQVVNPSNAYYRKTGKAIEDWTPPDHACGLPTASPAF